jgi:hypothetical protein
MKYEDGESAYGATQADYERGFLKVGNSNDPALWPENYRQHNTYAANGDPYSMEAWDFTHGKSVGNGFLSRNPRERY